MSRPLPLQDLMEHWRGAATCMIAERDELLLLLWVLIHVSWDDRGPVATLAWS